MTVDLSESIIPKSDQPDTERWAAIPGFTGYEASDQGRVRSLNRVTDRGRRWRGRLMTPTPMANGYLLVTLWRDGKQTTRLVHRLVLAAFIGEAPEGMEALHGDANRTNNRLSNLSWGTHGENQLDQIAHGTHANASKSCCPRGHAYSPENTYIYPGPRAHRGCRICRREHSNNQRKATRA